MKKKILITGSNGFLGQLAISYYRKQGLLEKWKVVVYQRFVGSDKLKIQVALSALASKVAYRLYKWVTRFSLSIKSGTIQLKPIMCNKVIRFFTTIIFSLIPFISLADQIETKISADTITVEKGEILFAEDNVIAAITFFVSIIF